MRSDDGLQIQPCPVICPVNVIGTVLKYTILLSLSTNTTVMLLTALVGRQLCDQVNPDAFPMSARNG